MSDPTLRNKLDAGEFILAPGLHDMMAGVLANKVGFDVVYATGYWLTASAYGLPDAGIATYTQMLDRVATLARTVDAAVIADADTGYGGLLNVHHTVRGYEEAGVTGIQIEDQEFPKKCGHTPGRRVVAPEAMAAKIRVACAARRDPVNTLIIARTDARQVEGFEAAVARGQAYAEAGADVVFVEALESEEEMREACRRIDRPLMANMSDGGNTPIRSREQLMDIGYQLAIFPATTALAAAAAIEKSLRALKDNGVSQPGGPELFDFQEFCRLIGFEEVWDFEKRWADAEAPVDKAGRGSWFNCELPRATDAGSPASGSATWAAPGPSCSRAPGSTSPCTTARTARSMWRWNWWSAISWTSSRPASSTRPPLPAAASTRPAASRRPRRALSTCRKVYARIPPSSATCLRR